MRKFGPFFSLLGDFVKGKLNLVVNEKVSHLVGYVHYTTKNITLEMAVKSDKLGLTERYKQPFTYIYYGTSCWL